MSEICRPTCWDPGHATAPRAVHGEADDGRGLRRRTDLRRARPMACAAAPATGTDRRATPPASGDRVGPERVGLREPDHRTAGPLIHLRGDFGIRHVDGA